MPKNPCQTSVTLHKLKLDLYLGWPAVERSKKQSVYLDVHLQFAKPPRACLTDALDDTVCYDALIQQIKTISKRKFHLIEHLGWEIYKIIQQATTAKTQIFLRITKKPAIKSLIGGASFCCGDGEFTWSS